MNFIKLLAITLVVISPVLSNPCGLIYHAQNAILSTWTGPSASSLKLTRTDTIGNKYDIIPIIDTLGINYKIWTKVPSTCPDYASQTVEYVSRGRLEQKFSSQSESYFTHFFPKVDLDKTRLDSVIIIKKTLNDPAQGLLFKEKTGDTKFYSRFGGAALRDSTPVNNGYRLDTQAQPWENMPTGDSAVFFKGIREGQWAANPQDPKTARKITVHILTVHYDTTATTALDTTGKPPVEPTDPTEPTDPPPTDPNDFSNLCDTNFYMVGIELMTYTGTSPSTMTLASTLSLGKEPNNIPIIDTLGLSYRIPTRFQNACGTAKSLSADVAVRNPKNSKFSNGSYKLSTLYYPSVNINNVLHNNVITLKPDSTGSILEHFAFIKNENSKPVAYSYYGAATLFDSTQLAEGKQYSSGYKPTGPLFSEASGWYIDQLKAIASWNQAPANPATVRKITAQVIKVKYIPSASVFLSSPNVKSNWRVVSKPGHVSFISPRGSPQTLEIYDTQGKRIWHKQANSPIIWKGRSYQGQAANGIYILKTSSGYRGAFYFRP